MNKEKSLKLQVSFSAVLLGVFAVALLYSIVNFSELWLPITAILALTLIDIFWGVYTVLTLFTMRDDKRGEQYDSIFKSEKSSYLLLRKYSEEIAERLSHLEEQMESPTENVADLQKNIAKVIISRGQENTAEITETLDRVEALLGAFARDMDERCKSIADGERLKSEVGELLQKELKLNMDRQLEQMEQRLAALLDHANRTYKEAGRAGDINMDESLNEPQESAMSNVPEFLETPEVTETLENLETPEVTENLENLETPKTSETLENLETPKNSEVSEISEASELLEAPEIPEVSEPTQAVSELSKEPDPNKVLSPDEIAALITSMGAQPAKEIELEENEIDLSDPNRKMTPEEIAALFANLG